MGLILRAFLSSFFVFFFYSHGAFAQFTTATGESVFVKEKFQLIPMATLYSCSDSEMIKEKVKKESLHGAFVGGAKTWNGDWAFVDPKTKMITACRNGKSFSAFIPKAKFHGNLDPAYHYPRLVDYYGDLNGDGVPEIILDDAGCGVHETCQSELHHIIAIMSDKPSVLTSFLSAWVHVIPNKGKFVIKMEQSCRSDGPNEPRGPAFFQLAELDRSGRLTLVPYQKIRKLYPNELKAMTEEWRSEKDDVSKLYIEAYSGSSPQKVLKKASKFGDSLDTTCSVPRIVSEILQLPQQKKINIKAQGR